MTAQTPGASNDLEDPTGPERRVGPWEPAVFSADPANFGIQRAMRFKWPADDVLRASRLQYVTPENGMRSAQFQHLLAHDVRFLIREVAGKREVMNFVADLLAKDHLPGYRRAPQEKAHAVQRRYHDHFYAWLTGRRVADIDDITTISQVASALRTPSDWHLLPTEEDLAALVTPPRPAPPTTGKPPSTLPREEEIRGFAVEIQLGEGPTAAQGTRTPRTPSPEKLVYYEWFSSHVAAIAELYLKASAIALRAAGKPEKLWGAADETDSRYRVFSQRVNESPDGRLVDGICGAWAIDVDTYVDDNWVDEVIPDWAVIDGHFVARVTQWADAGSTRRPLKVIAARLAELRPGEFRYESAPATVMFTRGRRYSLRFANTSVGIATSS